MDTFRSVNPARPEEVVGEYPTHGAADVDAAVRPGRGRPARLGARCPCRLGPRSWPAPRAVLARDKAELAGAGQPRGGQGARRGGRRRAGGHRHGRFVAGQGRVGLGRDGARPSWPTSWRGPPAIPVGVVGMITPWNFPVAIPSWKIFPALLAGNGVVIKPSEHAPACCEAFVDACVEAGIPADLVQVVHGFAEPAAALAVHPGVGAVSFTGSVPTGRKVAAAAMEIGPTLVSPRARRQERHGRARRRRPRPGGRRRALRRLRHVGPALHVDLAARSSTATSPSELVERIVEAGRASCVLGDPHRPGDRRRPGDHAPRRPSASLGMVDAAVAEGATVVHRRRGRSTVAGCEGGTFVAPTVLTGVRPDHRIAREEVFGPVLSVIEVDDLDEAIDVVNSVEYGLSAADLHPRHQRRPAGRRPHRHRHRLRQRPHHRRRDPAAVRRHQAHRQRLPRGRHPGHRAVQPGEDRVRRLLGPAAEGADRQPHPLEDGGAPR